MPCVPIRNRLIYLSTLTICRFNVKILLETHNKIVRAPEREPHVCKKKNLQLHLRQFVKFITAIFLAIKSIIKNFL